MLGMLRFTETLPDQIQRFLKSNQKPNSLIGTVAILNLIALLRPFPEKNLGRQLLFKSFKAFEEPLNLVTHPRSGETEAL